MKRTFWASAAATLALGAALIGSASASADTLTVCDHGCKYNTIQKAVDKTKNANKTTIKVKPGTYFEAAQVKGHKLDGLSIKGTGDQPGDVLLQGCGGQADPCGPKRGDVPQNGIEGLNVNGLSIENMQADDYAANGFFIHADPGKECIGFKMDNVIASYNNAYGMFAKHCIGGKITNSTGYGHGDSAIYIGETPSQNKKDRKWTDIANDVAYENVLGYSGTNSKYVDIHDSDFYNNGVGVVPNTLNSELFEPAKAGMIDDNNIFWNNYNYYMPGLAGEDRLHRPRADR